MALTVLQRAALLMLSEQPAVFKLQTSYTDPCRITGGVTGEAGDSLVPDGNHQVIFDLSDYLRGRIAVRGKTTDSPSVYTGVPASITVTFAEYYGGSSHNSVGISPYYVLDGRVPPRMAKAFYAAYTSVLAYLISSKSCLTWWTASEPKRVLPDQKEFLNYLQVKSGQAVNLSLYVTLLLNDGNVVAGPVQSALNNIANMAIAHFPVGYSQLGIPAFMASNYPTKAVEKYSVVIMQGSTPYSQVYNYKLESRYYHNPRQLWIKNPFGLYEALLCTGIGEVNSEHKPEQARTDGLNNPDRVNWKNDRTNTVKVNTGFVSAAHAEWLADLLDTTEACELINGVLYPITLLDSKITTKHDGDYLFSADIAYEYAYQKPIEYHVD